MDTGTAFGTVGIAGRVDVDLAHFGTVAHQLARDHSKTLRGLVSRTHGVMIEDGRLFAKYRGRLQRCRQFGS